MFDEATNKKLGNYVYRLIDPRNGETFYVGKGTGNRVFQHIQDYNKLSKLAGDDDAVNLKLGRIQEIRNARLEVLHVIHRHSIPEEAVFHVEAALIDAFPGLTNEQGGHGSGSFGPMHADQIKAKYALPSLEEDPPHKLVLININSATSIGTVEAILEQVSFAWRISVDRAKKADYVLAVYRGVVLGAFVVEEWLEANKANALHFGGRSVEGRFAFKGKAAPPSIWEQYVGTHGKRIDQKDLQHVQNPIRYWNI